MGITTCSATVVTSDPETFAIDSHKYVLQTGQMGLPENLNVIIYSGIQVDVIRTNTGGDTDAQILRMRVPASARRTVITRHWAHLVHHTTSEVTGYS